MRATDVPRVADSSRSSPDLSIVAPDKQAVYRTLRQYPLLDGIASAELLEAIVTDDAQIRSYWRDDIVVDRVTLAADGGRIFLVKAGSIAAGIFTPETLAAERAWAEATSLEEKRKKVRNQGPMIRLAEKNVAAFGEGDLFNSDALPAADADRCAFYAVDPAEAIVLTKARAASFTSRYPFFAQRLRNSVEVARARLKGIRGVKQEIFDFYLRHGLSVAETLRVRQIDRCIECRGCEAACEARFGHKRLSINGPHLGMIDFVYACRTCVDQRCVDPCNYDSIKFDDKRREVVINEATCTGCASCAVACPYGSIEMVDIEDPANKGLKVRLSASGALAFGDGTGRKARLEKIASKCDHCAGYAEQACMSHCPTGALIDIKPAAVFRDKSEVARAAVRAGYDQSMRLAVDDMFPEEPFKEGLRVEDFASARVKRSRLSPILIWGLGMLGFFAVLAEVVLRWTKPTWTIAYTMLRASGLSATQAALKVSFRAGCDLSVNIGYVGTTLMCVSMLYSMRKRFPLLERLSTSRSWFDLHAMGGLVGPLFILLHSAFRLDNWVSIGFWSMVLVVISGIVGRWLWVQVPRALHGRELDELSHERAIARLRSTCPDAVALIEEEVAAYRARAAALAASAGLIGAVLWIAADDLRRPGRHLARTARLKKTSATRHLRKELLRDAGELMLVERRRVLVPRVQRVLGGWVKVHVPFTFVMVVVSIIHIAVALTYSM